MGEGLPPRNQAARAPPASRRARRTSSPATSSATDAITRSGGPPDVSPESIEKNALSSQSVGAGIAATWLAWLRVDPSSVGCGGLPPSVTPFGLLLAAAPADVVPSPLKEVSLPAVGSGDAAS